jgi:hypothetical protein
MIYNVIGKASGSSRKSVDAMDSSQTVTFVSGDVDANGQSIQLRIEVDAAPHPIDLRLQTTDLAHLVSLLLLLGAKVPQQSLRYGTAETLEALPLPLRGASLGTSDAGEQLLLFDVGATVLAFSLPTDQIGDIGRALLAMGDVVAPPQA